MTADTAALTTVETSGGPMPAHLWLPPGGSGPGLVLVQEIFGVSTYIRRRAADLAALGYVVLAPEVYWRLDDHEVDEGADDVLDQAMSVAGRVDWTLAVDDVRHALGHLARMSEVRGGCGLIGFCFGGGLAFHVAAETDPTVLVSYYGSALPHLLGMADQVLAPSLHHFGLSDAFIPEEERERIRETFAHQTNVSFATYAGANHAFDNSDLPQFYDAEASAAAWERTVGFLREKMPVG